MAVEGVIGVGKTTLVQRLTHALGGRAVLEGFEDNPFLEDFYRDREGHALSTQLFFLMARFRQQEELAQADLFRPHTLADYLFDKDRVFAAINLAPAELAIYDQLFEVLQPQVPTPDLVIHLRADVEVVLERIRYRGRPYELGIEAEYLLALERGYDALFGSYRGAPVLTVDTDRVDLRTDGPAFEALLRAARTGELPGPLGLEGEDPAAPPLPGLRG